MTNLPQDFDFAQSMNQIQEITQSLQSPDFDLSQSIPKFQQAQTLIAQCQQYLQQVESEFIQLNPDLTPDQDPDQKDPF